MDFVWHQKTKLLPGAIFDYIFTEIQLDIHTKQVTKFVVIQWYEHEGVIHEIKKHDCAHGKYHMHNYYEGTHTKEIDSDEPITPDLVRRCRQDILENWLNYRERYGQKTLRKESPIADKPTGLLTLKLNRVV